MEHFNWQLSIELLNGRGPLAKEMLHMFMDELPQHQKILQQYFDDKNYEELGAAAHKLLGSTCYVGLPNLKKAAKILETLSKENQTDEIPNAFSETMDALNAIKNDESIKEILSS